LKLDSVDLEILRVLLDNGREPFSKISRKLSIPVATVHSRVKRMTENGLIKGFTIYVNPRSHTAETVTLSIGIRAIPSKIEEVCEFMRGLPYNRMVKNIEMAFVWSCKGWHNIGAVLFAKTALDTEAVYQLIKRNPSVFEVRSGVVIREHWLFKNTFLEKLEEKVNE
jgi:DNA-binding Lrp family transcriptional regulator